MVRSTLDLHPQICCYGEIFHQKQKAWYPDCEGRTIPEIEQWMIENAHKPRYGFAIHICGRDATHAFIKKYWTEIQHDPRTPIVYVFRRNQLRQTLSQYRSVEAHRAAGGGWMSYKAGTPDFERFRWTVQGLETIGRIQIPCEEFHDHTVAREASEIMFFAHNRFQRICPVAYEDFVETPVEEMQRISDFLEVDFCLPEPQTVKTGKPTWEEMIANVDEFRDYFSKTPYARWL